MSRRLQIFLAAVLSILIYTNAYGADLYIKEVRDLLNSLPHHDRQRPQLTLKLADALFADVLEAMSKPNSGGLSEKQLSSERREAIALYESALTGLGSTFQEPNKAQKARIGFQIARLYTDEGRFENAEAIWARLAQDETVPELQREALLRMAEIYENRLTNENLEKAERNYQKALTLCSTFEICTYCHYRLAWVYRNQHRTNDAVVEIQKSLWNQKNEVREEPLRDLISFFAESGNDGHEAWNLIDQIGKKTNRPSLLRSLADGYLGAGNKPAAIFVLDNLNHRTPTLSASFRLLEETYAIRDWPQFNRLLTETWTLNDKGAADAKTIGTDAESEKVLRRLSVQLDGERATLPSATQPFKQTALLYLQLFGLDRATERKQMIEGWLNAETDPQTKLNRLATWISEDHTKNRTDLERQWRTARAAIAQQTKAYSIVQEETLALAALAQTSEKRSEFAYQHAYARYLNNDFDGALTEFVKIAEVPPVNSKDVPSRWAVQSEQLALDILAKKKAYADLLVQTRLWTNDKRFDQWRANSKENSAEFADIKRIEMNSEFEWATSLGEKPEALAVFDRDCQAGMLVPKSCANAQLLAVKLANEPVLLRTLKKMGKEDELANEMEASGDFAGAAVILEKGLTAKTVTPRQFLKVALLYELAENRANRDRILKTMVRTLPAKKSLGEDENLIYATLKDANLLGPALLNLEWHKDNRSSLVEQCAAQSPTGEAHKILARSCEDTGPMWEQIALIELKKLDDAQTAIHFSGKNGQSRFKKRIAALKREVDLGNCYLQSSPPRMRAIVASVLARSQNSVATEIKSAAIPEDVDKEGRDRLTAALNEMAAPFDEKAQSFAKLAAEQTQKMANEEERQELTAKLANEKNLFAIEPRLKTQDAKPVAANSANDASLREAALTELQKNANQPAALEKLKTYYGQNGQPRLAAYFEGRLKQFESTGAKPEETKQ